jgi:hypothetical protein
MSRKSSQTLDTHNPEDWAVLQQILSEEDEDDDAWVDARLTVTRNQSLSMIFYKRLMMTMTMSFNIHS